MSAHATITHESDFAGAIAACRRRDPVVLQIGYFLPKQKTQAIAAIVSCSRLIRDAISVPEKEGDCCGGSAGVVEVVRTQIERVFSGELELPNPESRDESQHVLAAFAQTARDFDIPRELAIDFVDGCREDLSTVRYATWNSLQKHCDRVGGNVAAMIAGVLGGTHSDVRRQAMDLGAAVRLLAIVRSMNADAKRGRVYLPIEDLARHRYPERELLEAVANDRREQLIAAELDRVRSLIDKASAGVAWLASDGSKLAAAMAIELFRREVEQFTIEKPKPPTTLALLTMLPRAARLARREAV